MPTFPAVHGIPMFRQSSKLDRLMVLGNLSQVRGTTSNLANPLLTRRPVGLKRRYCIRYATSRKNRGHLGSCHHPAPLPFFCQQHTSWFRFCSMPAFGKAFLQELLCI